MKFKAYRKKPVTILALEWNGENFNDIKLFTNSNAEMVLVTSGEYELVINTLEGQIMASKGDYIIRGIAGEYYPIKKHIFFETYEEVE